MNSPDIRISTTLTKHRKYRRLKRYLGPGAMECLVSLWSEAAEQAPTGSLKGWENEDIAVAAGYEGENVDWFVETLHACGFLDACSEHYSLHDWAEHQSWVVMAPVRKRKARNAAQARWKCSEHATSMPAAMPLSSPNLTKEKKTPRVNGHAVHLDLFPERFRRSLCFVQAWTDWEADRKERKKPLTKRAAEGQMAKLTGDHPCTAAKMVRQSIDNGWAGIFEMKSKKTQPQSWRDTGTGERVVY